MNYFDQRMRKSLRRNNDNIITNYTYLYIGRVAFIGGVELIRYIETLLVYEEY